MTHSYHVIEKGQPLQKASKALIALHGRGGTAQDILKLAQLFCDDTFYIAAPQAIHNSWYPYSFMAEETTNEPWLTSAVNTVKQLIDEIAPVIPKDQIYILGFSQGACLALETTARFAEKYGGVAAFTGGLIGQTLNETKYRGNFAGTKIFIGTSDVDPHIPLLRAQQSEALLNKLGANVTLKVYPGIGHTINDDEINYVKKNIIPEGKA